MKLRALVVSSILLLAGCGGGGGGTTTPTVRPTAAPTNSPTGNYKSMATLKLAIPLPVTPSSTKRNPQYIAPTTNTFSALVNSVNGSVPPSWVTPNPEVVVLTTSGANPNCVTGTGTETCTVSIPAPSGTVNYTFTLSDGSKDLSTFRGDETITQGGSTTLNVTLQGIVNTVDVATAVLTANAPPTGNAQAVTVTAYDADGNVIVAPGSYSNPITLTDGDATGATQLSLNAGTAGSTLTVASPADTVTLTYLGQATNNFTIVPSGTGIACGTGGCGVTANVNDVTLAIGGNPITVDDTPDGGLNTDQNWLQQTMFFPQASGSKTVDASELGFTNAPFSKLFTMDASACTGIATVAAPATPATSFTVTATGVGVCKVKLNENGTGYPLTNHATNAAGAPTHDGTFWVSVTAADINLH